MQLEALALVHSLAVRGQRLLGMEDLYMVLCHALVCPRWPTLAADLEGPQRRAPGELQYLREAESAWAAVTAQLRCVLQTHCIHSAGW